VNRSTATSPLDLFHAPATVRPAAAAAAAAAGGGGDDDDDDDDMRVLRLTTSASAKNLIKIQHQAYLGPFVA